MSPVFELDHAKLVNDPRFAELARELEAFAPVESNESFNRYCRAACRLWHSVGATSTEFTGLLNRIDAGGEEVIQTGWGGVVITLHEPPRVEKYLVVRHGGYLALEMHEQKDEHLEVREGAGLILWRQPLGEALTAEVLQAGAKFHLRPGTEHCLIGTENLLVFEHSIDPKGMDQDLIFIYTPMASATEEEAA